MKEFGILTIIVITLVIAHYFDEKSRSSSKERKSKLSNKKTVNTRKLNIISNRVYDKSINNYYNFIVKNMSSSTIPAPTDFQVMNELEEIFIKEFLYQVQFVRKKYSINLIRYSNGHLMVNYNGCPVGRIDLKNKEAIYMQVLIGLYNHKEFYNITFEQALQNIKYWISYVKNHLKQERF